MGMSNVTSCLPPTFAKGTMSSRQRILAIRLGAMGDIFHAMPAVASLRRGYPDAHLSWIVEPKWKPLLEGCPFVDEVISFDRSSGSATFAAWRSLGEHPFDMAVDFQGLLKSSMVAMGSKASLRAGYTREHLRERMAGWFYTECHGTTSLHMVDKHRDLAKAVGGKDVGPQFYLPDGSPEGTLPTEAFVLACPQAGWGAKQWPSSYYEELETLLKEELGLMLVLNGPPGSGATHCSGLSGLIYATRLAHAVVGLDSGPMHMAAAIGKPGVAIFGPTDPARNGPYGGTISVLRTANARTTYKRHESETAAMQAITPRMVMDELKRCLATCSQKTTQTR